jgi:hypothetical protein
MKRKILYAFWVGLVFVSCGNRDGLFGHSKTKGEAIANGSTVVEYIPDKTEFNLLDGTKMQIDTAWTEVSFTYKNGKRILDSTFGYSFGIPYNREIKEDFSFTFTLADSNNQVFTNGREENVCRLHPRNLLDSIQVLLEQKNTDKSIGWQQPIITDTITFIRIYR